MQRQKENKLKNSKENIIKQDERNLELRQNLNNMANVIDYSITGSLEQLDESQSLIAGNLPPTPILNPYRFQFQYPEDQQFRRIDSASSRQTNFRQPNYRSESDDALTVSDVIQTSIRLFAPPPTPSTSRKANENCQASYAGESDGQFSSYARSRSPCTTISIQTYQFGHPPNSLASSLLNLTKLDDF